MLLTVLVPAYNEEATILTVLERVSAKPIPDVTLEVIVIDDGSKDGTAALLEANPSLYAKFIKLPQNGGKGAAVRAGLQQATGDYVVFQDADLEYDPADFAKLILPVQRFDADVVMGSRMLAPEFTRVHYFWHKRGNELLTFVFNLVNNTTFTDTYTCYLLYRRSLLEPAELKSDGWEQHAEILSHLVRRAKAIYEVPVTYAGRTYAEGKKIRASHAVDVIGMIVRRRIAAFWESPWTRTTITSTATKTTNGQSSPSSPSKSPSSTAEA
jgi:glycosyltransferase involved in cell wall biosynthesis